MGDRGARMRSTMSDTFWILVLSIVVLFAFFIALGAFSPGEVAWLTLAVLGARAAVGGARRLGRPPPHRPRPRGDPQPRAAGLLSSAHARPGDREGPRGDARVHRAAGARGAGRAGAGRPRGRDRAPVGPGRAGRRGARPRDPRAVRARSPRACTGPRRDGAAPARGLPARRRLDARLDRVLRHGRARARQRVGRDRRQRRLPARARGAVPGRAGGLPVRGPLAGGQRGRARRGPRAARDRRRQRRRQPRDGRRAPPARRGRRCGCRR